MIEFKEEFINEFKNKIVFAPNGFGKTTLSKKIKEHLDTKNPNKTLLFTRKSMEDLVTFDKNNFYFGETANLKLGISKTEEKFSKSSIFKDFIQNCYGVKSGLALTKKSLFFSLKKIKNLKTESLLTIEYFEKIVIDYGLKEAIKLDSILNNDVFGAITEEILKSKEVKFKKSKKYITQEIYFCLQELNSYADENKLDRCPLCGKKFKNEEFLKKAIEKCFSKYETFPEDEPSGQVIEMFGIIFRMLGNSDDLYIKMLFDGINFEDPSFKEKVEVLQRFYNLCDNNNSIIFRAIHSLKIGNESVGELIKTIEDNKLRIHNSKEDLRFKTEALKNIEKEFSVIAKYCDAKILPDYENFSLSVKTDNDEELKVSETLSESELKRLSLVVILAKIKYSGYDCIILDDPIDSYDDYYLSIVCEYIAALLKTKSLTNGFYVFTNNYTALFNLSKIMKINSIIFYEDPDIVFLTNATVNSKYLYLNSTFQEVAFINKSELVLLKEFLNPKKESYNADFGLSFLAFLTTIRNLKTEVISGFSHIRLFKNKNITKQFQNKVKECIEHCYMHYEPGKDGQTPSDSVSVSTIVDIYESLTNITSLDFTASKTDKSSIVEARNKECCKPFRDYKGNKLLALIFKKILFVSELKFSFEKILLETLHNRFHFDSTDIERIANSNKGFGDKINMAKRINKRYGYVAKDFLGKVESVHKENSQLVNQFDHGLAMMFPPYLNTRIFDIKKYKDDIDLIKNNF